MLPADILVHISSFFVAGTASYHEPDDLNSSADGLTAPARRTVSSSLSVSSLARSLRHALYSATRAISGEAGACLSSVCICLS
jgi:hypothetical protein